MRLRGKTALVTGGGSGFGEGIARLFAAEGAAVLVVDIDEPAAQRVAGSIVQEGGRAEPWRADVGRKADAEAMVKAAVDRFGRLDICVNNAGWSHKNKPIEQVSEDEFDRVFTVNVKAIYLAALALLPQFRRQGGGVIVNTSSTAALRPRPNLTVYNASKGAVNTMTKSMAVEFAPLKVRVNAICPVIGETALTETFMGMADTPENRQRFLAGIPLGRYSRPEDIARAALYLASDEAEFITGVCLEVDGGRCV